MSPLSTHAYIFSPIKQFIRTKYESYCSPAHLLFEKRVCQCSSCPTADAVQFCGPARWMFDVLLSQTNTMLAIQLLVCHADRNYISVSPRTAIHTVAVYFGIL